eukprot:2617057-Prymnesium_polylepis.1
MSDDVRLSPVGSRALCLRLSMLDACSWNHDAIVGGLPKIYLVRSLVPEVPNGGLLTIPKAPPPEIETSTPLTPSPLLVARRLRGAHWWSTSSRLPLNDAARPRANGRRQRCKNYLQALPMPKR